MLPVEGLNFGVFVAEPQGAALVQGVEPLSALGGALFVVQVLGLSAAARTTAPDRPSLPQSRSGPCRRQWASSRWRVLPRPLTTAVRTMAPQPRSNSALGPALSKGLPAYSGKGLGRGILPVDKVVCGAQRRFHHAAGRAEDDPGAGVGAQRRVQGFFGQRFGGAAVPPGSSAPVPGWSGPGPRPDRPPVCMVGRSHSCFLAMQGMRDTQ